MPWGVGSGDRIFPAGEAGPGQATAHKGTICMKIQFAIIRMPKESSTLSVLFPCAAAISPDHGKHLKHLGRRGPCQS